MSNYEQQQLIPTKKMKRRLPRKTTLTLSNIPAYVEGLGETLLTPPAMCSLLNMTTTTLERYEASGLIRSTKDEHGRKCFAYAETYRAVKSKLEQNREKHKQALGKTTTWNKKQQSVFEEAIHKDLAFKEETKSAHFQMLLKPSTKAKAEAWAEQMDLSLNQFVNKALTLYIEQLERDKNRKQEKTRKKNTRKKQENTFFEWAKSIFVTKK